jgi:hypothetical protein
VLRRHRYFTDYDHKIENAARQKTSRIFAYSKLNNLPTTAAAAAAVTAATTAATATSAAAAIAATTTAAAA